MDGVGGRGCMNYPQGVLVTGGENDGGKVVGPIFPQTSLLGN